MKLLTIRLVPVLAALALFGDSTARADFVNFGYHWSVQPSSVLSGGPGSSGNVQLAITTDGTGSATPGSSTPLVIPAATITTNTAASSVPDHFQTSFTMKLHLTDSTSGQSGDLSYTGTVNGTLTTTTSTLTSTFSDPLTQQLTLGGHTYSVTIDPRLLSLPVPGSQSPAMIDALVTVGGSTTVNNTPEPSSLALGCLALSLTGFAARIARKRRRLA
jgi:hypothetical protein